LDGTYNKFNKNFSNIKQGTNDLRKTSRKENKFRQTARVLSSSLAKRAYDVPHCQLKGDHGALEKKIIVLT